MEGRDCLRMADVDESEGRLAGVRLIFQMPSTDEILRLCHIIQNLKCPWL